MNNLNKEHNAKILCAYHMKTKLFKNTVIIPVLGGAVFLKETDKNYKWLKQNLTPDNIGENISKYNKTLNEMTIVYWGWKNFDKIGTPDYIGLNHYRRLFNISGNKLNKFNIIKSLGLDSSIGINKIFTEYDVIAQKLDFNTVNSTVDMIETYVNLVNLKKKHPGMYNAFLRFKESKMYYSNNCVIFKKEDFFKYCETIFDIILPVQKELLEQNHPFAYTRDLGCTCEFLTGFYIDYLEHDKNYKIKDIQLCSLVGIVTPRKLNKNYINIVKKIFSVENHSNQNKKHKVFTLLGLKLKFKMF